MEATTTARPLAASAKQNADGTWESRIIRRGGTCSGRAPRGSVVVEVLGTFPTYVAAIAAAQGPATLF